MTKKNETISSVTYNPAVCPVAGTLKIIGGKWKPMILYLVGEGINRFGQLSKSMPEISKHVLTQQLRDLETDGVISREVFAEIPPRVEYTLTEKGRSLLSVTQAMMQWGLANL
ncbi:helix-turn-helix domain-containing protein [Chitinophaga sp. MM2321]|uniref:winged helix-turn-helix transcriptional regulator n=1 Tax=Chitinophaga sp. MM2321 TaxID=3137178 RepID=UPI0032D56E7E